MTEAYFEPVPPSHGTVKYPFEYHIQTSGVNKLTIHAHWHYYIEMLYSLSGRARVILSGECYDFNKGGLILINAREVHSIFADDGEDPRYIVLKFDPEVLYTTSKTIFESKYVLPFTMTKSTHQKLYTEDEIRNTPVPSLIAELSEEFDNKKYGFELAVRTNICRIFLWVLRNWQEHGINIDPACTLKENDIQMLQKVFDYLDENYKYEITVEAVAQMCSLSYSYFSRQFKAIMGKTFTEYLNYIRITEAEKLLLTTDLNITQIALETGFSNSSYFIRQFKHYKAISPKQFKKKMVSENSDTSQAI